MRYTVFLILFFFSVYSCKNKKPNLLGEEPVKFEDFIESFREAKPPYEFRDTLLQRREKDSMLISYKVFTQFVPDSVVTKAFGKGIKPRIYPIARVAGQQSEKYLLAKTVTNDRKIMFLLCFNRKDEYLGSMQLMRLDNNRATEQVSGIDRRYNFYKSISRRNPDATISEGKDVYGLNSETGQFDLIMTDLLDEKPRELVNPIDTMPRKNKYSADYVKDKSNVVSIRDGARPGKIIFFIHFEQNRGACIGELKGEAKFTSATKAVYNVSDDVCKLEFRFTSSSVTLHELSPCGNSRGLRCSFNGTYPKKRVTKSSSAKK